MDAVECLDQHQLGAYQANAIDIERGRSLHLRRLRQVDEEPRPVTTGGTGSTRPFAVAGANAAAGTRTVAPAGKDPSITLPCVASTVTSSPSRNLVVASPVPTTQGIPSSRETIAA